MMKRNRRAGVEDRWTKTVRDAHGYTRKVPSAAHAKGLRWRARYVGPDGKEHTKHFARKLDAQAWLDSEVTTKIGTHTWVDPSRSRELFEPMAEAWFASKATKKPKTVAGYRSILNTLVLPRWGEVQLSSITYEDVQTWISNLSVGGGVRFENKGLSASRVVQTYQVLNMVLKYAIRAKRLAVNPADDVELPPLSGVGAVTGRFLTHRQVHELALASGRFHTLVLALAYCGLRFGEAAALRRRDIDVQRARIWVRASATRVTGRGIVESDTKNHTDRQVPVPAAVLRLLERELPADGDALVFPGRTGGYLPHNEFRRVFDRAVKTVRDATEAKRKGEFDDTGREAVAQVFPVITPKDLRHTCASLAISAGANIKVVQTMLGHKTATMTLDLYGHLYPDDLDRVADALNADAQSAADWLRTERGPSGPPSLAVLR